MERDVMDRKRAIWLLIGCVLAIVIGARPGLAGNCSVSNGVAVGDCGPMKFRTVTGIEHEDKVIPGARVMSGGSFVLSGVSNGDLTVDRGGSAVVSGTVNGSVINNGGTVEIRGTVTRLQANGGETTVYGIVQAVSGSGTVRYKAGAIVAGTRIERDR